MNKPTLLRKRYIPNETVELKDDVILKQTDEVIVTKWNVLRPRKDFTHGYSVYYLKEGYKISKFLNAQNQLVYYYCDIIDVAYDPEKDTFLFTDLLADVIVYENGFVKVVDLAELAQAQESGWISSETLNQALRILDRLLGEIYEGNLQDMVGEYFD